MSPVKSMRTDIIERLAQHQMAIVDGLAGKLDVVVCMKPRGWWQSSWWSWLTSSRVVIGFYRDGEQKPRLIAMNEAAAKRFESAIPEAIVSY